jgi:tRNA 2-thiouridine synthesizing protein A
MEAVIAPSKTLDMRGHSCSLVMAKTKMALDEMEAGDVLEVLSTDACTEFDLPSWTQRTGKELLSKSKEDGGIKFYIKKL